MSNTLIINIYSVRKIAFAFIALCFLPFSHLLAQVNIIPQPAEISLQPGSFILDGNTVIRFEQEKVKALAEYLQQHIEKISGHKAALGDKGKNSVEFKLQKTDSIGEEGYLMDISPLKITIVANTEKGLFYAVQSLIQQLSAVRTNQELRLPAMRIKDYPRIGWRGMMLDVSRHFYSTEAIKELIDLLALYKMNVFHWHLTDNEGWRLEIKKYPKLTSTGAWRNEVFGSVWYANDSTLTWKDTYRYGGYYTQDQAREIVNYAAARNITVIPEIEMPGHSGAVLAAYPRFSCNGKEQPVPNSAIFNKFNPSPSKNQEYCAGNDSTFLFLQDVLKEVMAIFPSTYIHVGGDEVDKTHWKACPKCQRRIRNEKLKNEDGLQSYFIRRMEKFLSANNRKLLGWDEILEGGLAPSATVMSWRGEKGGIEAAKMGHDVIMSPSDPLYLNRYQAGPEGEPLAAKYSINTLEKVYQYDPYSKALNSSQQRYIRGVQVAIWTEFIPSVEHMEYMLLPRLPAIAEAAWTPSGKKDFSNFTERLNRWHFNSWMQKGIRFNGIYRKK